MKKEFEQYRHKTGIQVQIAYKDKNKKLVSFKTTGGRPDFVFIGSTPQTIKIIGKAFVEIANFVDKLKGNE